MSARDDLTAAVKAAAIEEGFVAAAIAPAGEVPQGQRLVEWLNRGWHAGMGYMERNLQVRMGRLPLMEGARSVICLAAPYGDAGLIETPSCHPQAESARLGGDCTSRSAVSSRSNRTPKRVRLGVARNPPAIPHETGLIARYARGGDYHRQLKKRCIRLMDRLRVLAPELNCRAVVDTAPVMERSLAAWSGLGWIGRNGCLFVPGAGSYVLLCEIFCNLPLVPGSPLESPCGSCGACAEACPTGAISRDEDCTARHRSPQAARKSSPQVGLVDARLCLSYLTVEYRGDVPRELRPLAGCRLFGCDRCQEACPHNGGAASPAGCGATVLLLRRTVRSRGDTVLLEDSQDCGTAGIRESPGVPAALAAVLGWSREDWDAATRGSATRRATWEMFLRNAAVAAGNSLDASLARALEDLARRRPELGGIAQWAIARLGNPNDEIRMKNQ